MKNNNSITTQRGQRWICNVDKKLFLLCLLVSVHNSSSLEQFFNLHKKNDIFYTATKRMYEHHHYTYEPLCKVRVNNNASIGQTNYFASYTDLINEFEDINNDYQREKYFPKYYSEIRCANLTGEVNYDPNNSTIVDSNNYGTCTTLSSGRRTFNCIQRFRILPYLVFWEPKDTTSELKARYAFRSQIVPSGCECKQLKRIV